jgi:hypothetical protein
MEEQKHINMYLFFGSYALATALGYAILIFLATKDDLKNPKTKPVVEKWAWIKSTGGCSGSDTVYALTNNARLMELDNEFNYTLTEKGKPVIRGRFETYTTADFKTGLPAKGILFYDTANHPVIAQTLTKQNGELILTDNIAGYYTHYYRKVH